MCVTVLQRYQSSRGHKYDYHCKVSASLAGQRESMHGRYRKAYVKHSEHYQLSPYAGSCGEDDVLHGIPRYSDGSRRCWGNVGAVVR